MRIEPLPWDSGFFGLTVGRAAPGEFRASEFRHAAEGFQLVYLFEAPGSENLPAIEALCGPPADIKLTYRKTLASIPAVSPQIREYAGPEADEQLIDLGLQSGIRSRFKSDSRFPEGSFERLYTEWVRRSADHSIAEAVLVFSEPGLPWQGFVTLQVKDGTIAIGLIAVDAAARGKGIGRELVRAAEAYAGQRNFLYLDVATQAANPEACRLYEACGFAVRETVHIYHYWNA